MLSNRQKRDVERLAGRRGDKEQRSVLWNEIDALSDKVAAKLANSRFAGMISPYITNVPIDEDALERLVRISPTTRSISLRIEQETREVNQRIDVAQTFIDNVIEDFTLALPDLDTAIQTVATDAQAEIDLARQEATNALNAVVGGYQGSLSDLNAEINSVETSLISSINNAFSDLDTSYYTIAQSDSAISAATTALKSEIEDPLGTSLGATLENNYYTFTQTDSAISAAQTTLQSNIDDVSADLTAEQVARSNADSAIVSDVTSLETRMGNAETDITNEQIARSSADSALASDITTLTTRINDAETDIGAVSADLSQNYYTNAQTDSAISSATTSLKAEIEDPLGTSLGATLENDYYTVLEVDSAISSAQSTLQSNIDGVASDLSDEQTARSTQDSALASDITTLSSRVDDAEADIVTEQTTRANADNALSQDISTVSADLAAAEASVTQNASAIATIESYQAATYTLRVDAGDAQGSLEIVASDDPINGPASAIRMKADKFLFDGSIFGKHIDTESLATDTSFIGHLTANMAFIADLTAQTAFIQNIQAIDLSADRITSGKMKTDFLEFDGTSLSKDAGTGYLQVAVEGIQTFNIKPQEVTTGGFSNGSDISFTGVNGANALIWARVRETQGAGGTKTATIRLSGVDLATVTVPTGGSLSFFGFGAVSAGTNTVSIFLSGASLVKDSLMVLQAKV